MPVVASDFPAGTANRLGMQYGCYILFSLATVAVFLRYANPEDRSKLSYLLTSCQNLCAAVQTWRQANRAG